MTTKTITEAQLATALYDTEFMAGFYGKPESETLAAAIFAALPEQHPDYGPNGYPWPNTSEEKRQELYSELLADGLSDYEARATIWPEQPAQDVERLAEALPEFTQGMTNWDIAREQYARLTRPPAEGEL